MIVGNAVATIEASTAGMKIAISAAASTRPRRGTNRVVRTSSTIAWSNKPAPAANAKPRTVGRSSTPNNWARRANQACHPGGGQSQDGMTAVLSSMGLSFPRKRESRATAASLALDPRFRGGDGKPFVSTGSGSRLLSRIPARAAFFAEAGEALSGFGGAPAQRGFIDDAVVEFRGDRSDAAAVDRAEDRFVRHSGLLGLGRPPQPDFRDQRLDRAAGKAETGFVEEAAVADLALGRADDDLARQRDPRQARIEHNPHVFEASGAAQRPARGRHDRDVLIGQDRLEGRARGPVDRVFQDAGDAVVELRRAQYEPVRLGDVGEQLFHDRRPLVAFEILVVEWDRREVVDQKIGAAGEFLAQRLKHRVRIGTGA